jgi:benzoate membrane transport protein
MSDSAVPHAAGSIVQPISSGILAAVVGFGGAFTIVLAGFTAAGASQAEAASGLFAITLGQGILGIVFAWRSRLPITIAWSTPGAVLLIAAGRPEGGYPAIVGAYLVAAALIVAAGLWRPFGRLVASIPVPLAGAMLGGILLELCLAPVHAVAGEPFLALPILLAWIVGLRFARPYAVPIAVVVTVAVVAMTTTLPAGIFAAAFPHPVFIIPAVSIATAIGIGVPLFIVTMASQNVPGLAVLAMNGYKPDISPIFVWTGLGSVVTALFGGQALNLAAITAALCAGPEAHVDPSRRWIASVACGISYLVLALGAGFATAFVAAAPPLLIQAVAGLALLGSLGSALSSAMAKEEFRIPAAVTFVTTASGATFFGISTAFWGLLAGGVLMVVLSFWPRL